MHLSETCDGNLEFSLISDLFGLGMRISECIGLVQRGDEPIDAGCDYVLGLRFLEQVHTYEVIAISATWQQLGGMGCVCLTFIVNIRSVVNNVDAMLHAHLNRIPCTRMCTQQLAELTRLVNTSDRLLVGKITVLSRANLGNLDVSLEMALVPTNRNESLPLRRT